MQTHTLWEFLLPIMSNDGRHFVGRELKQFEDEAIAKAGGFTRFPAVRGAWTDDNGKLFEEDIRPYRIACDVTCRNALVLRAFDLFPDQQSIMVSAVGQSFFFPRTKPEDIHA